MNTYRQTARRIAGRTAVLTAGALSVAALGAPAAWAHVEATATPAKAGATNATVDFSVEAESSSAGIAKVKVQLPAGIAPKNVTLAAAPTDWNLLPTADGYAVSGPALGPNENLEYAIRITKLPDKAGTVLFKTVETYTDGKENAWIEEPGSGGAEPEHPAPAITLGAAGSNGGSGGTGGGGTGGSGSASGAAPSATGTPSDTDPTAGAGAGASPAADSSDASKSDDGSSAPLIITLVAVVVVLGGAGGYFLRRRQAGNTAD